MIKVLLKKFKYRIVSRLVDYGPFIYFLKKCFELEFNNFEIF